MYVSYILHACCVQSNYFASSDAFVEHKQMKPFHRLHHKTCCYARLIRLQAACAITLSSHPPCYQMYWIFCPVQYTRGWFRAFEGGVEKKVTLLIWFQGTRLARCTTCAYQGTRCATSFCQSRCWGSTGNWFGAFVGLPLPRAEKNARSADQSSSSVSHVLQLRGSQFNFWYFLLKHLPSQTDVSSSGDLENLQRIKG